MRDSQDAEEPPRLRRARYRELSELTDRFDTAAPRSTTLEDAARLVHLYERACEDLAQLHEAPGCDEVLTASAALVARAHGCVYRGRERPLRAVVFAFLRFDFPRLVRKEWRLVGVALSLFLCGGLLGAMVVSADMDSLAVVIPESHQTQSPGERVRSDSSRQEFDALRAAEFATFLFTHNIEVAFLFFALGISAGVGTVVALAWNGVPIGALAAQYHSSGQGAFFWAWILPHGVLEVAALAIAGGAGLVIARAFYRPGDRSIRAALGSESRTALALVLGCLPLLVIAGLLESSISQMHGLAAPASVKFAVAAVSFVGLAIYLLTGVRPLKALVQVQ